MVNTEVIHSVANNHHGGATSIVNILQMWRKPYHKGDLSHFSFLGEGGTNLIN